MALAAMGRGVWERDTPPLPRGRLRRPGTPPGSLRGERGPFSGGHPWVCCSHGRCGPVLRARPSVVCGEHLSGGDDRERALGSLAVGEPPLKRRHAPVSGDFDLRGRWFRVWGA